VRRVCFLALIVSSTATTAARSDVIPFLSGRRPGPPISVPAQNFVIERDQKAKHARMIVPQSMLPVEPSTDAGKSFFLATALMACCLGAGLLCLQFAPRIRILCLVLVLACAVAAPVLANMPIAPGTFDLAVRPFGGVLRLILPVSARVAQPPSPAKPR
jgi:hypothetical protein